DRTGVVDPAPDNHGFDESVALLECPFGFGVQVVAPGGWHADLDAHQTLSASTCDEPAGGGAGDAEALRHLRLREAVEVVERRGPYGETEILGGYRALRVRDVGGAGGGHELSLVRAVFNAP